MRVYGKKVLLDRPTVKEPKTILEGTAKADFERGVLEKCKSLKVYAAGEDCTFVKEGDFVYVKPENIISRQPIQLQNGDLKWEIFEGDITFIY